MRSDELKPFDEAARNLLDHPDGFLTQLLINYIGAGAKQLTEPRFWSDVANEYNQSRYDALVLLVNNVSYLRDHMSLCGLPIISFDHVQFHIRYQLFLFEKIIFVNSKYTYAKKAEIELYGDGHGSLEEFFEGLKTLAEAIKSRNTRFDQFGNQVLIEGKKAPSLKTPAGVRSYKFSDLLDLNRKFDAIDEADEQEAISEEEDEEDEKNETEKTGTGKTKEKKNKKGKKGRKKPNAKKTERQEANPTKPSPWELKHPERALLDIAKIFRNGDADISQGFMDYLKDYTPPNCDQMSPLPNPANCKPTAEGYRMEEQGKVLKFFGLQESPRKQPLRTASNIEWTNIYPCGGTSNGLVGSPPGLFPLNTDPNQIVYLDEHSTELGIELPAEDGHVEERDVEEIKAAEPTTLVDGAPKGKLLFNRPITLLHVNDMDLQPLQPIHYIDQNTSPLVDWRRVNINFPPEVTNPAEYLLVWKWAKKDFKVLRNCLKRAADAHDLPPVKDTLQLYDYDSNKMFFYLFTVKDLSQHHLYKAFAYFTQAILYAACDMEKTDMKGHLLEVLREMETQFRSVKAKMGYMEYRRLGRGAWLRKDVCLDNVLDTEDFDWNGHPESEWRFQVNRSIHAGVREVPLKPLAHLPWCSWLAWLDIMECIGHFTAEAEPVWLSEERDVREVNLETCAEAGFIRKDLILSKLWPKEVREKYDLPRRIMLKIMECHKMQTDHEKLLARVEDFNREIEFNRLGCPVAPTMYHAVPIQKSTTDRMARGVLLYYEGADHISGHYLTRPQIDQTLRLLVELHRFGAIHPEDLKLARKTVPQITREGFRLCMSLATHTILDVDKKLLALITSSGGPLLCGDAYLGYRQQLPSLMGSAPVLSHGWISKSALDMAWEEDETGAPGINHLTSFKDYLMAPLGYDLAFLKANLLNPNIDADDALLEEYSQLLTAHLPPSFAKSKDGYSVEKLKELLTIFFPYAMFRSFFYNLKRYVGSTVAGQKTPADECEKNRLHRKAVDLGVAIINYYNYENAKQKAQAENQEEPHL